MKLLFPLLMMLAGTGAGVAAGVFFRPEATIPQATEPLVEEKKEVEPAAVIQGPQSISGKEYLKLSNQFVVPIVEKDRISALVVMTLSVEVPEGKGQDVMAIEPKVRDVLLRVLFDHAAIGGFRGDFANNENLDVVRGNMRDAARESIGADLISDILIFEIARQDY